VALSSDTHSLVCGDILSLLPREEDGRVRHAAAAAVDLLIFQRGHDDISRARLPETQTRLAEQNPAHRPLDLVTWVLLATIETLLLRPQHMGVDFVFHRLSEPATIFEELHEEPAGLAKVVHRSGRQPVHYLQDQLVWESAEGTRGFVLTSRDPPRIFPVA